MKDYTRTRVYKQLTPAAQEIFDKVFLQAQNKQIKIKPKDMPIIDKKFWDVLCFNFALIAASAYEGQTLIVEGIDLMPKV